ncbi:hypothetical protein [Glycomyces sp. NPDC048151]|uniref:hypothetical protein n=1 Tax=Glycomyces sp. NPDC048151 TaxID=3364002 RepID=UPI003717B0F4
MEYESLEPPFSGRSAELFPVDPQITVEADPDAPDSGWAEPVPTGPEYHRCPHWLRFADLNAKGRMAAVGGVAVVGLSWAVIVFGLLVGLGLAVVGFGDDDLRLALIGLLLVCGSVLQSFGAAALTRSWRRLHRPGEAAIPFAAVGFLVFLAAMGAIVALAEIRIAPLFALPFAVVVWQLFWFRSRLYGRDTCQAHPGHAPAIRALLRHDPGSFAAMPVAERFSARDCPHRIRFGDLHRRYQAMAIANTVLLYLYIGAVIWLVFVLNPRPDVDLSGPGTDLAHAFSVLALALVTLAGVLELGERSRRYHRAPVLLFVAAFCGYGLVICLSVWAAVVLDEPSALAVAPLAAYWAVSAGFALVRFPPRSECRTLEGPPPFLQKMLQT